jgi:hypothetical protein
VRDKCRRGVVSVAEVLGKCRRGVLLVWYGADMMMV